MCSVATMRISTILPLLPSVRREASTYAMRRRYCTIIFLCSFMSLGVGGAGPTVTVGEHNHGSQMGSGVGRWDRGLQLERIALPGAKMGLPEVLDAVTFARSGWVRSRRETGTGAARRSSLNCTRQWGKSTVTAA